MGFDGKKFSDVKFEQRTTEIEVKELAAFFNVDEKPVFKVRGLSGKELGVIDQLVKGNFDSARLTVIKALISEAAKDKIDGIAEIVGGNEEVAVETRKRMEYIAKGLIEPELDFAAIDKLCIYYPAVFIEISNKIIELTGLGGIESGESKPSGRMRKSEQASIYAIPEGDLCLK